jgi:hypothetical protein
MRVSLKEAYDIRRTSLPILTEEANREGEPERGLLEGPASQSGIPQIREGCWIEAEVLLADILVPFKCLTEEELSDFRKL